MDKVAGVVIFAVWAFCFIPLGWAFIKWGVDVVGAFWGMW